MVVALSIPATRSECISLPLVFFKLIKLAGKSFILLVLNDVLLKRFEHIITALEFIAIIGFLIKIINNLFIIIVTELEVLLQIDELLLTVTFIHMCDT